MGFREFSGQSRPFPRDRLVVLSNLTATSWDTVSEPDFFRSVFICEDSEGSVFLKVLGFSGRETAGVFFKDFSENRVFTFLVFF